MLLQGIVLILLVTQTSQENNPPPQKALTKSKSFFDKLTSSAVGTFNKVVFGKVDVASIFNPVFDDVQKKIGTESCIAGLLLNDNDKEQTLKLIKGHVSELHSMSTESRTVKEGENTIEAVLEFLFPKIPIKYEFEYTRVRLLFTAERIGAIRMKQEGPITVLFNVELPKSHIKVDEMLKSKPKQCVAIVKSVKTTIGGTLVVDKVIYDSLGDLINYRVTEGKVRLMLKGMEKDIKDNIEAAVKLLVEPSFRGNSFICNDASYTVPIANSEQTALDCNHIKKVENYKKPKE